MNITQFILINSHAHPSKFRAIINFKEAFFCWSPCFNITNAPGSSYTIPFLYLKSAISPKSLLLENDIRNPDLDTRCAHCHWSVTASRPSQWTEAGNVCLYANHVCAHIYASSYVHLYMCVYVCIYTQKVHPDTSNSNPAPQGSF